MFYKIKYATTLTQYLVFRHIQTISGSWCNNKSLCKLINVDSFIFLWVPIVMVLAKSEYLYFIDYILKFVVYKYLINGKKIGISQIIKMNPRS